MGLSKDYIPSFFHWLMVSDVICREDVLSAGDGFYVLNKSLYSILSTKEIETFPDRDDQILECRNFFDDWFFYVISNGEKEVYSLFKMREQEYDQERGIQADGDTPGVTISFISGEAEIFKTCLEVPSIENRKKLGMEINRVVAYSKQKHNPALKEYFVRPEAEGAYLIADLYTQHIASYAVCGILDVPKAYRETYRNRRKSPRIPDFIERNNLQARSILCDHEKIYLKNTGCPSIYEKLTILATHCGNVSFHSFAAEVQYHAMFLTGLARVRIPFVGTPYASAIRADMSIGDKEFQGPTPYYDLRSKLVTEQIKYHKKWLDN